MEQKKTKSAVVTCTSQEKRKKLKSPSPLVYTGGGGPDARKLPSFVLPGVSTNSPSFSYPQVLFP